MRTTVCDICGNQSEGHPDWIEASIPAVLLGELGERLNIDVCSLVCLSNIGNVENQAEETDEPDEPERQISVPMQSSSRFVPLTQQQSEDATGVRRRY